MRPRLEGVDWRARLCCPRCRGLLAAGEGELRCASCPVRYEVNPAGVPILLIEEDRKRFADALARAAGMRADYERRGKRGGRARWRRRLAPPLPVYLNPSRPKLELSRDGLHLWLGGGGHRTRAYLNLDLAPFAGVDVAGNALRIPFCDSSCDTVACHALLEHVEEPWAVAGEIHRVLKPGGVAYVSAPFFHPWHGYPSDFFRFTREGLRRLFEKFEVVEEGVHAGPTTALLTFLTDYAKLFFPVHARNPLARAFNRTLVGAFGWMTAPLKYLDAWLLRKPEAYKLADTVYLVARKK